MKTVKNFIVAHINSDSFVLGQEVLFEQIKYVICSAKKNTAKIIFVVSFLEESMKILNDLFIIWREQKKHFNLFEHLKSICKKTSIQFGVQKEISFQLEKYFQQMDRLLNKKINLDLDPIAQTRDQAQLLIYGDLISSLILFHFIRKNFPKMKCFLGDSSKLLRTNIGPHDSHIEVQLAIQNSYSDIITFFNIYGNDNDVFVFQDSIVRTENGNFAIMVNNGVPASAIYASACFCLGKVELIDW